MALSCPLNKFVLSGLFEELVVVVGEPILFLVPLENIPRVNLVFHVVKHVIITVGEDCAALRLEFFKVVDNNRAKEIVTILERRFVDDDSCALSLDELLSSF